MYNKIMIPVDLEHEELLQKAIKTGADLARHYAIPVVYVGVTSETPTAIAHTPAEFEKTLEAFADTQAAIHGQPVSAKAYASHDPAVDLDKTLSRAVGDTGADLVVMATHAPRFGELFRHGHANALVGHTGASVFVVR